MDGSGEDELDLVVVGAHLSGMPLNGQLTTLGARLVARAETAPEYRLFALSGTVPPKPGLLRVGPAEGRAVGVEVWRMDKFGFATFVSAIPAPLGIGRVVLADGRHVQGFLVESIAVADATDITEFGGWRSYVAALNADSEVTAAPA